MAADFKALVKTIKLRGENPRGRKTIYVDSAIFKKFQATCAHQGLSASQVLEEFMREAVTSQKKKS